MLEQSLPPFVLEKRARSKLGPAKSSLSNILSDVHTLASVNLEVAQSELDRVSKELTDLEPVLRASQKAKAEVSRDVNATIETAYNEIYDHTRTTLASVVLSAAEDNLGLPYPGLFMSLKYTDDLKDAIISQISIFITTCEELP
jgi:mitofusin